MPLPPSDTGKSGSTGYTYASAGVDIDAGNAFVKRIAPLAKSTARAGAEAALGGFGALFDLKAAGYDDPLIVSATDGVGTKLELAIEMNKHDTIGIDLVAMCVNDLIVQGAEPLFFLDYLATGKLDLDVSADIVKGIAQACRETGSALIGGETAEMPGLYQAGHYDLAGFAVGAVDRDKLLPRADIGPGDVLLGLASSGIHSNGYSLVRRLVADTGADLRAPLPWTGGRPLGEVLLTPTQLYVRPLLPLLKAGRIKALAHITGGGLTENLPRVLPRDSAATIDLDAWARPPVFTWLRGAGGIAQQEMLRTFNCGIGMVLVVGAGEAEAVGAGLAAAGHAPCRLGALTAAKGEPEVLYSGTF